MLVYCFKSVIIYIFVYVELFEVAQRRGVSMLPTPFDLPGLVASAGGVWFEIAGSVRT